LKLSGRRFFASVLYKNMWAFQLYYRVMAPFYTKDPRWPEMMDRDLSKTTLESSLNSIASLRKTDLRPCLPEICIPSMGVYGDKDIVVDPQQWQLMSTGIPNARIERFPKAGHFPMLDEPQRFSQLLKEFLDAQPSTIPTGISNS
jgi:pimeloyl-ACP methyl ester carboxylesterase